jgi:hypothetical protein
MLLLAFAAAACGEATGDPASGAEDGPMRTPADPSAVLEERFGFEWPNTDFSKVSIDPDEVISGGPGKDGIPSIDDPQFVSTQEAAEFLDEREPVIALEIGGEARAYPLQILIWHEIVNDTVGGRPVAVTYCPLCNSAIAFDRELDGTVYEFGVSGLLRSSDLVMYDRQTESWWQQFTGEAIVGALTGAKLETIAAPTVSFRDFRETYPDGLVLSRDTGFQRDYGRNPYAGYDTTDDPFLFGGDPDERLPAAERVVAVELNGETVAYPFSALEEARVVEDTVGGEPVVVFFQPGTVSALDESTIADSRDVGSTGVFRPEVDGRPLTFVFEDGAVRDRDTGSEWNVLGHAVSGELEGAELPRVVHGDHFWFAWAAFKPETRIWSADGATP